MGSHAEEKQLYCEAQFYYLGTGHIVSEPGNPCFSVIATTI